VSTSPATDSFDRASEVAALLDLDDSVLGRLWAYEKDGLSPQQMAEREETSGTGWVSNYRMYVRVLRDGEIPTSPSNAAGAARRIRAWLKLPNLSPQLREALATQEALISSRAEDRTAQIEEESAAVEVSRNAEAAGTPGIYVYTLPHYLRYPYEPDTGRTLLKVGHSAVDAHYRASSQGRLTALPEDPILLRIYPAEESAAVERDFHSWLRAADHAGARTRRGGSEWFVTSTKFLDRIAQTLNLEVQVVTEFEAGE